MMTSICRGGLKIRDGLQERFCQTAKARDLVVTSCRASFFVSLMPIEICQTESLGKPGRYKLALTFKNRVTRLLEIRAVIHTVRKGASGWRKLWMAWAIAGREINLGCVWKKERIVKLRIQRLKDNRDFSLRIQNKLMVLL